MEMRGFWHLAEVSDARLRSGLTELLVAGHRTEARIIAHLAEVEKRKLHLKDGDETVDNLRLLCASHNRLLAERDFGERHVALRQRERARRDANAGARESNR
ncbi:MAG: hypothetical protein WDO69_30950 [Pseudomonadota bacterium]